MPSWLTHLGLWVQGCIKHDAETQAVHQGLLAQTGYSNSSTPLSDYPALLHHPPLYTYLAPCDVTQCQPTPAPTSSLFGCEHPLLECVRLVLRAGSTSGRDPALSWSGLCHGAHPAWVHSQRCWLGSGIPQVWSASGHLSFLGLWVWPTAQYVWGSVSGDAGIPSSDTFYQPRVSQYPFKCYDKQFNSGRKLYMLISHYEQIYLVLFKYF